MPWDDNDQLVQSEALRSFLWDKALEIGNKHLLNADRVYRILRHSVRDYTGLYSFREPPGVAQYTASYSIKFAPDLTRALEWLAPARALEIFEQYHPDRLMGLEMAFDYLIRGRPPFWTWDELAEVLGAFQGHLAKNRKSLLDTGIPKTRFARSELLDHKLNKLLYTKLPVIFSWSEGFYLVHQWSWFEENHLADERGIRAMDPEGNVLLDPHWTREPIMYVGFDEVAYRRPHEHHNSMRGPDVPTCEYRKAPVLLGLDPDHAQRLARLRPKMFELKMAILDVLIQALGTRSGTSVWPKTLEVVAGKLTPDEIRFLLDMESFFEQYPCDDLVWPSVHQVGLSVGGLHDTCDIVGHVECELSVGVFHKSRQRLVQLPPPEITSIYQVFDQPWCSEFISALNTFADLSSSSRVFWAEFPGRASAGLSELAARDTPPTGGAARDAVPLNDTEQCVVDALYQHKMVGVASLKKLKPRERPSTDVVAGWAIGGDHSEGHLKSVLSSLVKRNILLNGRDHGLGQGYALTDMGATLASSYRKPRSSS